MLVSLTPQVLAPTTVAVATSETTLADFNTYMTDLLSVQIENLDATQVFTGTVKRRLDPTMSFAPSDILDFRAIGPGETVVADLSVQGTTEVRITGAMSGAGGNVKITARRRTNT